MTESPTPQAKLLAVIQAQCAGGYNLFGIFNDRSNYPGGKSVYTEFGTHWHILQVLLDTEGLKAAYGSETVIVAPEIENSKLLEIVRPLHRGEWNAYRILQGWLSGGAEGALDTAFSLLPS